MMTEPEVVAIQRAIATHRMYMLALGGTSRTRWKDCLLAWNTILDRHGFVP